MSDTAIAIVQVLSVTLTFSMLISVARTRCANTRHAEKQPLPIPVECGPSSTVTKGV
jgi:hypothetical protein